MSVKNKNGDGEEYQYPDEEYVSAEPGVEPESPAMEIDEEEPRNVSSMLRDNPVIAMITSKIKANQRASAVIGLALVVLIGFHLFGSHDKKQLAEQQNASQAQQQTLQQAAQQSASANSEYDAALASLKRAERGDHSSIVSMQSQLQSLHSAVDQATAAQSQLSQAVAALANQVKELSNKLVSEPEVAASAKEGRTAAASKPVTYHIKAVVDGRAWIESSNGLSQSVAAGDSIPGYGTVKAVSANKGMVLTSSGKVIQYGENDK